MSAITLYEFSPEESRAICQDLREGRLWECFDFVCIPGLLDDMAPSSPDTSGKGKPLPGGGRQVGRNTRQKERDNGEG